MTDGAVLDIWRGALTTAVAVGAPFIVAALVVGLASALIQAATQLQENILSFVPKIIALSLVLLFMGNWLLDRLGTYTKNAFEVAVKIGQEAGK